MGFFDFFRKKDINEGLRAYRAEARAILIDVREQKEYAEGHLPQSRNIPLGRIDLVESMIPDKEVPLFLYCEKGARAEKAARKLADLGYQKVTAIGGVEAYGGKLEKGIKTKSLQSQVSASQMRKNMPWLNQKKIPRI